MGIFGESVEILRKLDSIRTEFIEMKNDFGHLEKSFEKFVNHSEKKIERVLQENEEMRRRITEIEGVINGTLKVSMHDAIKSLADEMLKKTGKLENFDKESVVKLLDEKANVDQ